MKSRHGLLGLIALAVVACHEAPERQPPSSVPTAQTQVSPSADARAGAQAIAPAASPAPLPEPPLPEPPLPEPPPKQEPPPKALSAKQCRVIADRSTAGFRTALAATKRSCQADAECMIVAGTCLPWCGGTAIAVKDEARFIKDALLADCKLFEDGDCTHALALPLPRCAMFLPKCVNGTCAAVQK